MTWSPLDTAGDWDRAVLGAESMVGSTRASSSRDDSSHWGERAGALLSAVFHAAALECASMGDVVASVNRREPGRWLSVLASQQNLLPLDVLTGIVETDEREQSGIWSTASSVLRAYRTGGALANSCGSPIDFSSLWRERSTLYVVAGSENQHHLAPLIAGLVRDLRSAVYDATGRGVYTPDPRPPVLLVLDELANSAPLHDLPALVADGASQGVVTLACLQDLSQARSRWGVAADGFFSLFGAKIVLGGLGDTRTLESLSLLAGEREVPTVSVTTAGRGRGRARSQRSLSTRRQRLLPPDAVAAAAPGRAICVFGASLGRVSLVPYVDSAPERPFGDRRAPRGLHR